MAASRVNLEVDERQMISATAAEPSRSSSEARIIVKSWADYNNHCADYVEGPISESKIRNPNYVSTYSNNDITGNYCIRDDEWQEESFFEDKIQISDKSNASENKSHDKTNSDIRKNVTSDCKAIKYEEENERFKNLNGKLEISRLLPSTDKIEEDQKMFQTCNRASGIVIDNQYCDVKEKSIELKAAIASIHNPCESAYHSSNADKTIGSNKSKRIGNIESHKHDCNKEKMEISSQQSRAYCHVDDVIVSRQNANVLREASRDEATGKAVHISVNPVRSPRRTRRSVSARNSIGNRRETRDRGTNIGVPCTKGGARKCESCGETHFSYDRQSHMQKYSSYLNRDDAATAAAAVVYETTNRDATKIVASRRSDSTRLAAPIATALLYRSRSLPRLSLHDSGIACSDHAPVAPEQTRAASRQLVADLRQLLTLKQHYYPEGGWGWVVLLVGLLVQILSHGTHGAIGVFLQQVTIKFGSHVHLQAG